MLSRRLCSALAQPLFYKQCASPRPVLIRAPQLKPLNLTLGCIRTSRDSCCAQSPCPLRPKGSVWKPLLCTFGVCSSSYILASVWEYENCLADWKSRLNRQMESRGWFTSLYPSKVVEKTEWETWIDDLQTKWKCLTPGKKVFCAILGLNFLIFAAWQVPRLCTFMQYWFTSNLSSGFLGWPLLLAAFSHSGIVHFGVNMYALNAAIDSTVHLMGKEQFAFFYMSAAMVASLFSYYWLLYNCSQACSLGASGAVFAVYGYMCTEMPDLRLQIIFLPMFDFSGDTGIKAIALLSLAGVIFKWQRIDHMCHLAGILVGAAYSTWGSSYVWNHRNNVKQLWEDIRSSITEGA